MTQARAYKTRGIVLRARNLGEADKIVTLLTTERGKIDAVAKGVRRAKSHLAGRLEFANEVVLTMHHGRSLDVIVTAELARTTWNGIVEPEAFAAANMLSEIVNALCEPDMPVPEVYDLLANAIAAMAKSEQPLALVARFQLRLLAALGLAPPANACIRCQKPLAPNGVWLDVESGGLAGPECRERWREALELSADDVANFAALAAARGSGATLFANPRVAEAVELLVSHHLGRRPRSEAHLAEFIRA